MRSSADRVDIHYLHGPNVGYGMGNNCNFDAICCSSDFLFVVVNPDIHFKPDSVFPLFKWCIDNPIYSCVAPLILNQFGVIQYSAKRNPTFFSLLIGRFSFLRRLSLFRSYDDWHKHRNRDYSLETFNASYLSGCFLVIPSNYFRIVGGFSSSYFLHLEDADIVRRLGMVGLSVHNPVGIVTHLWARGSHKSFKQMFYLIKSYLVYIWLWGFTLF